MNNVVTIGADEIDTDKIIHEAEAEVNRKRSAGIYSNAGLSGGKSVDPLDFKSDDEFLSFYLESLRETAFVDISDFEIEEKRQQFRGFFIKLKKGIWSLLRFYTYRMWSQQNQINGLLLSGIEGIYERQREEICKLEKRIAEIESKQL